MTDDEFPASEFQADLAVFRPRAARMVAVLVTVVMAMMMGLVIVMVPDLHGLDMLGFVLVAVFTAFVMFRLAGVHARPSREGLLVRNLFITTYLKWADIVNVRYGDDAWVQLELWNGDTLAVMGIQRADGAFARVEAQRLADLVGHFGTATEPDRPV